MLKKFISIILCTVMLGAISFSISASEKKDESLNLLLKKWEKSLNTKDLDLYLSVFDDNMKESIETAILNSSDSEKKFIEFFSTDKIKLEKAIEVPYEEVGPLLYDSFVKEDTRVYYMYYNSKIKTGMNSKYINNGLDDGENFRICVATRKENDWKISELSTAPVETFLSKGINLGSVFEQKILSGEVNAKTLYVGAPSTIRVQLKSTLIYNSKTNYQYWGVASGAVKSISFNTYIKDVLPNEWDSDVVVLDKNVESTKKWNSLKAGALMVKTFSWYRCYNPWNPAIGADVNDYATQCYLHETVNKSSKDSKGVSFAWGSMCSTAFNSYSNSAIFYDGTTSVIPAYYVQGDQNETYFYWDTSVDNIIYQVYGSYPYYYTNFSIQNYYF